MLAQWLVRFNPLEWHQDERRNARRLAIPYLIGSGIGIVVAALIGLMIDAGRGFALLTAGWITWSGIVALTVWRIIRRMDETTPALALSPGDIETFRRVPLEPPRLEPQRSQMAAPRQEPPGGEIRPPRAGQAPPWHVPLAARARDDEHRREPRRDD